MLWSIFTLPHRTAEDTVYSSQSPWSVKTPMVSWPSAAASMIAICPLCIIRAEAHINCFHFLISFNIFFTFSKSSGVSISQHTVLLHPAAKSGTGPRPGRSVFRIARPFRPWHKKSGTGPAKSSSPFVSNDKSGCGPLRIQKIPRRLREYSRLSQLP